MPKWFLVYLKEKVTKLIKFAGRPILHLSHNTESIRSAQSRESTFTNPGNRQVPACTGQFSDKRNQNRSQKIPRGAAYHGVTHLTIAQMEEQGNGNQQRTNGTWADADAEHSRIAANF